MGFLFAKKRKVVPEFTGLQIQTAVNVLPIPIVYGMPRIQMNIIYVNGFRAVAQKSGGGKGLLTGGKSQTTGYKYYATGIGALCEGPITGDLVAVFDNQQVYSPSTAPSGKTFAYFDGSQTTPWSIITTKWPDDAFVYRNTVYVGLDDFPLDSSATIPQLNFIIEGKFSGTCPLNEYTAPDGQQFFMDADPAECIFDFLTNEFYGVGFPTEFIDQDTLFTSADGFNPLVGDAALSSYCQAIGFGWSVVLNNAEPAASIIQRWLDNLSVAAVWTGSVLKFIPYWDSFNGANPAWSADAGIAKKYFNPDLSVLFDLTDTDFIQGAAEDDPVTTLRKDVSDARNVIRIDWRDRNLLFNSNIAEAKDETEQSLYGPRVLQLGGDEFTHINYAANAAQLKLQRSVAIRRKFEFKLPLQYCVLDPMDIVTITDSVLGLDQQPVRIESIQEDEKGVLTVVAEEFPIGSATAEAYARQETEPPDTLQTNIAPPDVNDPFIYEPPALQLAAEGKPEPIIVIGASGGPAGTFDPNWGGCNIFVSLDDVTYTQIGSLGQPSRHGETTSTLAAYAGGNPDNTNSISIDLSQCDGVLESVTTAQAAAGLSLCCIIDGDGCFELFTYTTATLTSPNNYTLSGLYRGLYGTVADSHLSGLKFLRVDDQIFEEVLPAGFVGVTIYIKFQSFNIWGQMDQDLADLSPYIYVPTGVGFNYFDNPLAQALIEGDNIDLDTFTPDMTTLDLGAAIPSGCIPNTFNVDLQDF